MSPLTLLCNSLEVHGWVKDKCEVTIVGVTLESLLSALGDEGLAAIERELADRREAEGIGERG